VPSVSTKPRRVAPAGAPISLGILIETTIASRENRDAVIFGLSDMVRHLRAHDEAFIMSFSENLVFEQDLTQDYRVLEQAIDQIQPHPGTALNDGVAFAAGHLNRIARNSNRVLLVISDGRNEDSRTSPIEVSAQLNVSGVRVYCIGMGVSGNDGKYRLQGLASRTGGEVSFISDAKQFRAAARQIAASLGIDFPL
jgi:hypothetical protein